jgi:hypothetical protein
MPRDRGAYGVTCLHCHKEFRAALLGEGDQRGFKCPHCRLFVPFERAEEQQLLEPTKT